LRALSDDERRALERLSRSHRAAAARVARATALLAVAGGQSYSAAARRVGRRDGDTVAARWKFTFTSANGAVRVLEEIAWQTWRGDQLIEERFFYDPKQMAG